MARVALEQLVEVYVDRTGTAVRAVGGIALTIEDREFMVLVGPSGCGKSTTLRIIAGLEEISGGVTTIDGHVVIDLPPKDRDIAMVFQNYALYPHMTVYENLAFGLKLRKLAKPEVDARVRESAGLLGLEAHLDRKPKALSGGQRQAGRRGAGAGPQTEDVSLRRAAIQPRCEDARGHAGGDFAPARAPWRDHDLRHA